MAGRHCLDDLIILHEGDFNAMDQKSIIAGREEISFMDLTGINWEVYPASIRKDDRSLWRSKENDGYRKMIRWYAVRIWPALKAKGYRWVMRLDDDSRLLSEIPYNIFGFMEVSHARTPCHRYSRRCSITTWSTLFVILRVKADGQSLGQEWMDSCISL